MQGASAGRIFISYRREDSADITGRIFDRLVSAFGRDHLFRDVDSMPLGVDFRRHIANVVMSCDVLLAVIGPSWFGSGDDPDIPRLTLESDPVHTELQTALDHDVPIIPVLVRGAAMPKPETLPEGLRSLGYRNAISIRADPDFHRDVDRLIGDLTGAFSRPAGPTAPVPPAKVTLRRRRRLDEGHVRPDETADGKDQEVSSAEPDRMSQTRRLGGMDVVLVVLVLSAISWIIWSIKTAERTAPPERSTSAEPIAPVPPSPAREPEGWDTVVPAGLGIGTLKPAVRAWLNTPRPENTYPDNGKKPTYGRAIDVYSIPRGDNGGSVSLGFIYAYVASGTGYEDTVLQAEVTLPEWPGREFVLAKIGDLEGSKPEGLSSRFQLPELLGLEQHAVKCVNKETENHAARIRWKSEPGAEYLYIGVWDKALHPQDGKCQ